ncbi:MAG: CZB domain-containing protein [Sphingomonadaceae bacterium]|jgi:hypothetical protein
MIKSQAVERLNDAIGAHGAWKLKLRVAMSTGASEIDPDKACKDDRCPFGRWIHGDEIDSVIKEGKPYQVVRRLHAEFHQTAANVLRYAVTSRREEAERIFTSEFAEKSDKLVRALAKWKGELL